MARNQHYPGPLISLIGGPQPDNSQGMACVQFKDGNNIVKILPACAVCIPPDDESLRNILYLENDNNNKHYVIGPWFEDIRPNMNSFTTVTIWFNRFTKQSNPKVFEIVKSDFLKIVNDMFSNFFILPICCNIRGKKVKSQFLNKWSSRIVLCKTPKDICEFYQEFDFFGFKQEQLRLQQQGSITKSIHRKQSSSQVENSLFKYCGFRINWNSDGTACFMKNSVYKTLTDFGIISIPNRKPNCLKVVGCYIKSQGNEIKMYSLLSEEPFSVHAVEEIHLDEKLENTSSQPVGNGSIQPLALQGSVDHRPLLSQETGNFLANGTNWSPPQEQMIYPTRDVNISPSSPPLSPPTERDPQTATLASGQLVSVSDSTEQLVTDSCQPGKQPVQQLVFSTAGSQGRISQRFEGAGASLSENKFNELLLNTRVSVSNINWTEEKAHQMLSMWRQKNGELVTSHVLTAALCEGNDLSDIVLGNFSLSLHLNAICLLWKLTEQKELIGGTEIERIESTRSWILKQTWEH